MFARLIGRSLEGAAEGRRDSRMGLRELDADHLSVPVAFSPLVLVLTMHGGANERLLA